MSLILILNWELFISQVLRDNRYHQANELHRRYCKSFRDFNNIFPKKVNQILNSNRIKVFILCRSPGT